MEKILKGILPIIISLILVWWFQYRTLSRDVDAVSLLLILSFLIYNLLNSPSELDTEVKR